MIIVRMKNKAVKGSNASINFVLDFLMCGMPDNLKKENDGFKEIFHNTYNCILRKLCNSNSSWPGATACFLEIEQ